MRRATLAFVSCVVAAAVLGTAALYLHAPSVPEAMVSDALALCALAVTAELLTFLLPASASGSIGFIPYFAAAVVVPAWPSVACVVLVKAVVELWQRRAPIKALLNISSHAIMELVAVAVYLALGGIALGSITDSHSLTHVTRVAGLPALTAFALALVANNLIVAVAIATSNGRRVKAVLQREPSSHDRTRLPCCAARLCLRMGLRRIRRYRGSDVLGADPRAAPGAAGESGP